MRIHIDELRPARTLALAGDEPWLDRIYTDFPAPAGEAAPRLTGELQLRREEGGSVLVTGRIDYAPFVGCSRCDRLINWPLGLPVEARFLPETANDQPKEKNLSRADLDAYYLENYEVDVEGLLNDVIQTALPIAPVPATEDGDACRICSADLTGERVYGDGDDEEASASPFSVLKGLKLKN